MPRSAAARQEVCQAVFSEIRAFCVAKANEERARRYARYFTEGYDAYGVDYKDPAWEANRVAWIEKLRVGPSAYLDLGDLLVKTGKYEEASFAIVIAKAFRNEYTPAAFTRIGRWFDGGIRNWGHTDVLCGEVLSPFLLDRIVELEALKPWVESPFKFKRRAVPVTLITLLDRRTGLSRMLRLLKPLMLDPERMVQQGVGWFLREAWKRHSEPIEDLLERYKETMPRVIVQYATEKMDKSYRQRFRRSA